MHVLHVDHHHRHDAMQNVTSRGSLDDGAPRQSRWTAGYGTPRARIEPLGEEQPSQKSCFERGVLHREDVEQPSILVHRLELGDRLSDEQEERVRPVDRARERRLILRERRVGLVRLEEAVDVVELALVLARRRPHARSKARWRRRTRGGSFASPRARRADYWRRCSGCASCGSASGPSRRRCSASIERARLIS